MRIGRGVARPEQQYLKRYRRFEPVDPTAEAAGRPDAHAVARTSVDVTFVTPKLRRIGLSGRQWLVLLPRLPAEPARYRMALWRELRRSGGVALGQAVWA